MKKSRFTEEQVVDILTEADKGDKTIGDICRAHGISQATFYNWRLSATHRDHVWTYDFVHNRTEDNHPLRMSTIEDEYTREGLAVVVRRHIPPTRVQEALAKLFTSRGAPEYVRSDNGPELVEIKLTEWLTQQSVNTNHIDPGSPWQNAYGESFNAILRRECLNRMLFHCVLEARVRTKLWLQEYNEEGLHSSLGSLTPVQFRDGVQIPLLAHERTALSLLYKSHLSSPTGKQMGDYLNAPFSGPHKVSD